MTDRLFHIDYKKLVQLLLPVRLRKPRIIAFLNAFNSALNSLYMRFKRQRTDHLYRLKITPQVVYLERMLNDKYDIDERRITITDAIDHSPAYLFTEEEEKPVYLYQEEEEQPVYLFQESETEADVVDFVIHVPADLNFNEAEMRSLVEQYKLAGKRFLINQDQIF